MVSCGVYTHGGRRNLFAGTENMLYRGRQVGMVSILHNYRSCKKDTDDSSLAHAPKGPPAESEV